jgi:subtilase family serine protease
LRAPASAAAGAAIIITETIINRSPLPAGVSTTRFFLSNDALFDGADTPLTNNSRPVIALPPDGKNSGSSTAIIPLATAPGKYFLIAVADGDQAVAEANESDNASARRITVTP